MDIDFHRIELGYSHGIAECRLFIDWLKSESSLDSSWQQWAASAMLSWCCYEAILWQDENSSNCYNYDNYCLSVCDDLKVIGLLMDTQSGMTKHLCFLCLWLSSSTGSSSRTQWPTRHEYAPGQMNVEQIPLVNASNVCLPPLRTKLDLMKNFVKALKKVSNPNPEIV